MQALLKAKDRATETTKSLPAVPIEMSTPPPVSEPPQKIDQPIIEPEKVTQEKPAPPEASSSTTTSLLEHKKALRKKRE